jgi:hypothetical protein
VPVFWEIAVFLPEKVSGKHFFSIFVTEAAKALPLTVFPVAAARTP